MSCIHVCACVLMHVCACVLMCMHVDVFTCVCICVCVCVYLTVLSMVEKGKVSLVARSCSLKAVS